MSASNIAASPPTETIVSRLNETTLEESVTLDRMSGELFTEPSSQTMAMPDRLGQVRVWEVTSHTAEVEEVLTADF